MKPRFRTQRPFSHWNLRPLQGESAASYFVRLVREQVQADPSDYAAVIGLRSGKQHLGGILKSLLSLPITDAEKKSLAWWTPARHGRDYHYGET